MTPRYATPLVLLALILAVVPTVTAITITSPVQNITAQQLPTTVLAAWDANYTTYNLTLNKDGTQYFQNSTADNEYEFILDEGNYELTVVAQNDSTTQNFTVQQEQPPIELTLSVQREEYEVLEQVQLTAAASQTVTATLEVQYQGETQDTYTIPLESNVNLIYTPEEPGTYTAILSAQDQQATATFTVKETPPLSIDFTHSNAYINKKTQFNATASGANPPYTYQWLFSDETSSTGKNVVHYFFDPGSHQATLIVTDAEGVQQSTTKSFEVTTPSYDLDVVVRQDTGNLVQGAIVALSAEDYEETKTTPASGLVTFNDLRGNYTLTLTKDNITQTDELEIIRDTTQLYTLNLTQEDVSEQNQTQNQTQNTTETQTPQNNTETEQAPAEQPIAQTQTTQETTTNQLRTEAKDDLTQKKFNLQLSSQKDGVLKTLDLYKMFDQALRQLDTASQQQISTILADVPTDVTIRDEQTTISYPEPEDIEQYTEEFLDVKGIQDDALKKQYRHSIQQTAQDVSVRTKTQAVSIHYPQRTEEYVIVTKEVTAPQDSHVVEFIPQTLAQDVSKLTIQGEYDVLRSNPVLRFGTPEYTYYAQASRSPPGYSLVVPEQLQNPPGLMGWVTVRFVEADPGKGILYIFLLSIFIGGILAGGKISKKKQSAHVFDEFASLTQDAIQAINNGRGEQAANITDDIIAIYKELSEQQQHQVQDIITHLKENQQRQAFMQSINHAYTAINEKGDINTVSSAYEKTLSAYEALTPSQQEQLQEHITQLHTYLDGYEP